MFKITINADEEMRKLIREEVRGALVGFGRDQVQAIAKEGIDRALSRDGATFVDYANKHIKLLVADKLSPHNFDMGSMARGQVRDFVASAITAELSKRVDEEIAKVDVKKMIADAIAGLRFGVK